MQVLCIGRIKEPRGLKGQFKITAFGDLLNSDRISEFYLYSAHGARDGFLIDPVYHSTSRPENITPYKAGIYLSKISGIETPEEVSSTLTGLYLGLELQAARKIFSDQPGQYLFQYIDRAVVDQDEPDIKGVITRIRQHLDQNWLVIDMSSSGGKVETLVPLKEPFVKDMADPIEIYQLAELSRA